MSLRPAEPTLQILDVRSEAFAEVCRDGSRERREWIRSWDALSFEHKDPLTHPVWILSWLCCRARFGERDIRLFVFRNNGNVVCAIPFEVVPKRALWRQGCLLSVGTESFLGGASIAVDPQHHQGLFARLFETEIGLYGKPMAVYLQCVDGTNSLLRSDLRKYTTPFAQRSLIDLSDGYDGLLKRVGKNFRGNLRKARGRLKRCREVNFVEFRQPTDVLEGLEKFAEVDHNSWKRQIKATLSDDESMQNILKMTLCELSKSHAAFVHILEVDGKAIAGQISFRFHDVVHVMKTSFAEGFGRLAPGNLLLEWTLKEVCIPAGIKTVSLVTDLEWHRKWRPRKLQTYGVYLFPPNVLGFYGSLVCVPLRHRLKSVLDRSGMFDKASAAMKTAKRTSPIGRG